MRAHASPENGLTHESTSVHLKNIRSVFRSDVRARVRPARPEGAVQGKPVAGQQPAGLRCNKHEVYLTPHLCHFSNWYPILLGGSNMKFICDWSDSRRIGPWGHEQYVG